MPYYPAIPCVNNVDLTTLTPTTESVDTLNITRVTFDFDAESIAVRWSDSQQTFVPFLDIPLADRTSIGTWMETKLGTHAMGLRPDQQE